MFERILSLGVGHNVEVRIPIHNPHPPPKYAAVYGVLKLDADEQYTVTEGRLTLTFVVPDVKKITANPRLTITINNHTEAQ